MASLQALEGEVVSRLREVAVAAGLRSWEGEVEELQARWKSEPRLMVGTFAGGSLARGKAGHMEKGILDMADQAAVGKNTTFPEMHVSWRADFRRSLLECFLQVRLGERQDSLRRSPATKMSKSFSTITKAYT